MTPHNSSKKVVFRSATGVSSGDADLPGFGLQASLGDVKITYCKEFGKIKCDTGRVTDSSNVADNSKINLWFNYQRISLK